MAAIRHAKSSDTNSGPHAKPPICIQDSARVQTSRARQYWALWCRAELIEVGEVVRCGGHVASGDDQFGDVMKPVTMACA
jgi:hypothetical protein